MLKGQKVVQQVEAERFNELMALGHIEPGAVAIDGGAHVGSWAVHMARYFEDVYAFEPCNESYELLCENTNSLPNVKVLNLALMDDVCTVSVHRPKGNRQTLTARQVSKGGDTHAVSIDSLRLDACDLIKLDLEGAEPLALLGARDTIEKFRPFLVIEIGGLSERFGYSKPDLIKLIRAFGYEEVWMNGVDRGYRCKIPR